MPRSMRSAPWARAAASRSSSHAKTYVGRPVSRGDGTGCAAAGAEFFREGREWVVPVVLGGRRIGLGRVGAQRGSALEDDRGFGLSRNRCWLAAYN